MSYLSNAQIEKKKSIECLWKLFEEIDINGDALLEFEELTSYCVEAGMIATNVKNVPFKYYYLESKEYEDRTTIGDFINRIRWIDSLQRLFVIETNSKLVRVYNSDVLLCKDIDTSVKSFEASIVRRDEQISTKINNGQMGRDKNQIIMEFIVLDIEYIPTYNQLVTSTSDFALTFWDAETYRYLGEIRSTLSQNLVRWCPLSACLLTTGTDGVIFVWEISSKVKRQRQILVQHTDIVMEMLECSKNELVVTCGMDHKIYLWNVGDFRPRGQLFGHVRGIRCMVYSDATDTLFTAGFEYDIFVWDLGARHLITKLSSHRVPIADLKLMKLNFDHLVSGDEDGTVAQ